MLSPSNRYAIPAVMAGSTVTMRFAVLYDPVHYASDEHVPVHGGGAEGIEGRKGHAEQEQDQDLDHQGELGHRLPLFLEAGNLSAARHVQGFDPVFEGGLQFVAVAGDHSDSYHADGDQD